MQPNIIFCFSDQQRADTCGCYGQRLDITPHLDAMADEGVRFDKTFSAQPVCGPCRALFQTGIYPTETGCFRNSIALPQDSKTLGCYFHNAGYETAYVGKWHLASTGGMEEVPVEDFTRTAIPLERRGGYRGFWRASDVLEFTSDGYGGYVFDENMKRVDFKGYRADCITDFGLEFLETRDRSRPLFLTISHVEPHHQNDAGHYQGPEGSRERFADFDVPGDLEPFEGDYREEYPDYLGACERVDWNLGRLIRHLKKEGIYDNTIIVYTSDHGSHFKTRNRDAHLNGYDDYKRSGHDASLRVPLVIRGGKFLGGKVIDDVVSTAGLTKTLLSAAGIDPQIPMAGEDLASVLEGDPTRKNEVFAQVSESCVGRVIRTPDFTYAVYAPDKHGGRIAQSTVYADDYLYDLQRDPHQLSNVVGDEAYSEIKADLRERLIGHIARAEYSGDTNAVRII